MRKPEQQYDVVDELVCEELRQRIKERTTLSKSL
jgi:hypothetical protein